MRAKVEVNTVLQMVGSEQIRFNAVRKDNYPTDGGGLDENNTYARWTPMANFEITINNPALIGKFKPGQKFYVDFTEAQ